MRDTMSDLVTRVRGLIGDPSGDTETFTDDDIEQALDSHVAILEREMLVFPDRYENGAYTYGFAYLDAGDLEAGVFVLRDLAGVVISASLYQLDAVRGTVTFTPALTASTSRDVAAYGARYDVYGAAADLLEAWAARVAREFDFETDGQSFKRSQQAKGLRDAAMDMRRRQRPTLGRQVRTDEAC